MSASAARFILGLDAEYPNNSAWRFVDADFIFPNQSNPWATSFPEVYNVNNLPGDIFGADFIAIMIGNVQGGYTGGLTSGENQAQARSRYALSTNEAELQAGETHTIHLSAGDYEEMVGFQGTLELGESLELLDISYGALNAGNINLNLLDRNQLPMSFHSLGGLMEGELLMSLTVRAREDVVLSDQLQIGNLAVRAEAYDRDGTINGLGLDFGTEVVEAAIFQLYQNTPNPVSERTSIRWNQVEAGPARLEIRDISGRTVANYQLEGISGLNRMELDVANLPAGVLTYTLVSGKETATKSMVVTR
ncbi:MAG: T9SS type A sorting domain-containing protein [Bacteroidota bacterium]